MAQGKGREPAMEAGFGGLALWGGRPSRAQLTCPGGRFQPGLYCDPHVCPVPIWWEMGNNLPWGTPGQCRAGRRGGSVHLGAGTPCAAGQLQGPSAGTSVLGAGGRVPTGRLSCSPGHVIPAHHTAESGLPKPTTQGHCQGHELCRQPDPGSSPSSAIYELVTSGSYFSPLPHPLTAQSLRRSGE